MGNAWAGVPEGQAYDHVHAALVCPAYEAAEAVAAALPELDAVPIAGGVVVAGR